MVTATSDLAERLTRADSSYWHSWGEAVRDLHENPHGVEVFQFGRVSALHVHSAPVPVFNRVLGIGERDATLIDDFLALYGERFTPCRFDIDPFSSGPGLLNALNDRGLHPSEFQTTLYRSDLDDVEEASAPGVEIRPVNSNEIDFYAQLYESAYHGDRAPALLSRFRIDSIKARFGVPGWTFYMMLVDGVPAGGAALHVADDVATLAGGATMYTLRGRGCQSVAINRRLIDAAEAGCRIAVTRCGVGTPSQRNMERSGFSTAYTKSVWQQQLLL